MIAEAAELDCMGSSAGDPATAMSIGALATTNEPAAGPAYGSGALARASRAPRASPLAPRPAGLARRLARLLPRAERCILSEQKRISCLGRLFPVFEFS